MAEPTASVIPVDSFSISLQASFVLYTSAMASHSPSGKLTRKITTELTKIGLTITGAHCPSKQYSISKLFSKGRCSWIDEAYGIFFNLLSFKRKPDIIIQLSDWAVCLVKTDYRQELVRWVKTLLVKAKNRTRIGQDQEEYSHQISRFTIL